MLFETIKKAFVAIVFALILILTVHRAAATTLPAIPDFASQEFSAAPVDCENIKNSLDDLEKTYKTVNGGIVQFTKSVAQVHEKWHRKLSAYEGRRQSYEAGEFSAITEAVRKLEAASDDIFAYEEAAGSWIETWGTELMQCAQAQSEWAAAIEIAAMRSREHFSATGNFFAQIQIQLSEWARVWKSLEGKTEIVPEGYFQPLAHHVEVYSEAEQLFRENADLSLDSLGVIRESDFAP